MSTPVTAAEVTRNSNVWHDKNLCHVTTKNNHPDGTVYLQWTENLFGTEATCSGSFAPGAYFGEATTI